MAYVHFIWFGPFPFNEEKQKLCVETPIAVAHACPDHKVIFWCIDRLIPAFKTKLTGKIEVRVCNWVDSIVGQGRYQGVNRKCYEDAQDVLLQLEQLKAFSAAKDMLSLIILHSFGGYYLDTTTLITPSTGGNKLNKSLKQAYPHPRLVMFNEGEKLPHVPGIQTGRAISGEDARKEVKPFYLSLDLIDVWAMYSPQDHPSFELMLYSYVSRSNRMGLYPGGTPINFDKLDGNMIMKQSMRLFDGRKWITLRDRFIGSLIIHAVYDGLLEVCCNQDSNKLSKFCWKAEKISEDIGATDGNYTLPELGINKFYKGSWRFARVPEEENKATIKEENKKSVEVENKTPL